MRYLIIFIMLPFSYLSAEQTGNLIINGDFENNNSNNWITTGEVQVLSDCCGSNYDLEFGLQGSIEQDFSLTSDTITQQQLNNGITLNSSVLIQNGECGVAGCWGGQGGADSFSIRLQIKDSDNNILSTTTQERYNVTDINGKIFENNISYSGVDSNIGNIFISGTDTNGVARGLGGANIDNVSVIMTYEPTVLTASQTSHINTTIQGIEESLSSNVETIEFIPMEEFKFEIFQEPELVVQTFEEVYFKEIKKEEINAGVVNVFFEPVQTMELKEFSPIEKFEEIPMEISYEEPTTLESFSTKIENFEERIETKEIESFTAEEFKEFVEAEFGSEPPIAREEPTESEPSSETIVAEQSESVESPRTNEATEQNTEPTRNSEQVSSSNERATTTESVEESSTESEQGADEITVDNRDINSESNNNTIDNQETNAEVIPVITIAEITKKVNNATQRIDQRLISTNYLVANAMQSNVSMEDYGNINSKMFDNLLEYKSDIPYGYQKEYIDNRNIYVNQQLGYNDIVTKFQKRIEKAEANEIRAKLELERIINGY